MKKRLILTIILVSLFMPTAINATMSNNYDTAVAATNSYAQKLYDDSLNSTPSGLISSGSALQQYAMTSTSVSLDFIINSSCISKKNASSLISEHDVTVHGIAKDDAGGLTVTDTDMPYDFINGKIQRKDNYHCGGMLSHDEFNISKNSEKETYLYNGNDYWTMTDETNKAYIITHNNASLIALEDKSSTTGVRITQYFDSNLINGEGTYSNPWTVEKHEILNQATQSEGN